MRKGVEKSGNRDTERGHKQDDQERIAATGKKTTASQTDDGADGENGGGPKILRPEVIRQPIAPTSATGAEVSDEASGQANAIHACIQNASEIENYSNRAAKLRPEAT